MYVPSKRSASIIDVVKQLFNSIEFSMEQQDITDEAYFSDNAMSNSGLQYLCPEQGGSPKQMLDYLTNPDFDDPDKKFSKALERGKLFHHYVEDPENFYIDEATKPTAGTNIDIWVQKVAELIPNPNDLTEDKIVDIGFELNLMGNLKDKSKAYPKFEPYIDYLNSIYDSRNYGYVVTKQDAEALDAMVQSLAEFEVQEPKDLIKNGIKESVFTARHIPSKTLMKSKLDNYQKFSDHIKHMDVKTYGKGSVHNFHFSLRSYRYYRQLAMYDLMLRLSIDDKNLEMPIDHNILVIKTAKPYDVIYYKISNEWLDEGYMEIYNLLMIWTRWKETGYYAPYSEPQPLPYIPKFEDFIDNPM